jgi:catechol 2,3-dioxygenase-like lactoylglutathione lyase family enzyme
MSTTTESATVSRVANVIVPVRDQEAMLAFYTGTLGLEKRADVPFGDEEDGRWIEVGPPGAETPIALCPPGPKGEAGGKDTGITLQVGDIDAYHAQLAAEGVDVDPEVSRMGGPVPPLCWFRDPEGNTLMVVEVS